MSITYSFQHESAGMLVLAFSSLLWSTIGTIGSWSSYTCPLSSLCLLNINPLFNLPDIIPAATVDVMGDFLSLTRARNEKSRPSRAMAKMIRGRGNMEPSRLGASVGMKTSNGGWQLYRKQEERMKVSEPERGGICQRGKQGWWDRDMGFEVEDLAKQ